MSASYLVYAEKGGMFVNVVRVGAGAAFKSARYLRVCGWVVRVTEVS